MKFRSQPLNQLSPTEFDILLHEKDVFELRWNKRSPTLRFRCQAIKRGGKKLVTDKMTRLTWQQSGSPGPVTYRDAEKYIRDLNKKKFAGFKNWRLPTLDEAMSLLRPSRGDTNLYIDPAFDPTQQWIWTWDESDSGAAWVVTYRAGCCYVPVDSHYYVRAVRGEFWYPGDDAFEEDDPWSELIFSRILL
ncbi:MAG: DUF1566 domain-containing protein [candidate division KSB1 bacterium]|nr:DUF1566 domain-containing protein [candidate division KSB1 bacterium]MDZ7301854.1 DUF1566 domain-containing protein [candidate division KSB1 bacterium]MDZ7310237.1 DUF1566 domain-containing protein [candidate division KSB1 bacterium]